MRECFLCGRTDWIERHHVYGGSRRKHSEKQGMVVDLCHYCHNEPPSGAHHNKATDLYLKQTYQQIFEETHSRDEFRRIFGKSYL